MRPPLVPVPRLPLECNLCGHSRRRSLSCSPRRYSTGCSNRCPLPQGICRVDVCISSCLSCLPFEQFPVQPANLYDPLIGIPRAKRGALLARPPSWGILPRFPSMRSAFLRRGCLTVLGTATRHHAISLGRVQSTAHGDF